LKVASETQLRKLAIFNPQPATILNAGNAARR
jgi:hypothetical protein